MYKKLSQGWLKHLDFIVLDLICLQLSFLVSYVIRHGMINPFESLLYRNYIFILFFCQIVVVFFGSSFHRVLKRGYYKEFKSTVKHVLAVMLIAMAYLFITQNAQEYSRIVFLLTGIFYFCSSYSVRVFWKRHLMRNLDKSRKRSLIVITNKDLAQEVLTELMAGPNLVTHQVTGVVLLDMDKGGDKEYVSEMGDVPVIGDRNSTAEYICREWVDEVLVYMPESNGLPNHMMDDFVDMGLTVHQILHAEGNLQKQYVEQIGSYTVLTKSMNIMSPREMFFKRTLDILGGIVGCVITGILFIFVAPAIYIKSPGSIFFSQVRIGKNGRKFRLYKFRSMYPDAEARKQALMEQNKIRDGMMFKMDHDPRIIGSEKVRRDGSPGGIGNFIRRTSIDEFPQFWNVLKGDMSLVGTRPPTVDEWEKYSAHHRARMAVKPGITGLWQISGRSNILDFEEVVKMDVSYIENWTMDEDIKILAKTVVAVLRNEGAA